MRIYLVAVAYLLLSALTVAAFLDAVDADAVRWVGNLFTGE
jgi:hypothetical protein